MNDRPADDSEFANANIHDRSGYYSGFANANIYDCSGFYSEFGARQTSRSSDR